MTIKEYIKIYSVNPLYLIFKYTNGHFEEINGNKYLTQAPTNESPPPHPPKKNEELLIKVRDLIRPITKNSDDYE